jgi:hypothetical protein
MKQWPQVTSAALSILGATSMWWFISGTDVGPLIWNIGPYVLCLVLAALGRWPYAVLFGVILMFAADAWLILSSALSINQSYLLGGSLASTLKAVLLLPVGLAVGAARDRRVAL